MNRPLLKAEVRGEAEKGELKKLRGKGFVPAVIYGHKKETQQIQMNKGEVDKALKCFGVGSSVELHMGNDTKIAIIKDIQRHITKLHVLHIDLQELDEGQKVRVKIPIHLINKSAVESSTAVIQQQMAELEIQTYPQYLPQMIDVDVSSIKFGAPLIVRELAVYDDGYIEVLNNPEEIVALLTTASQIEMKEE